MYECEECHESSEHSKYHVPMFIETERGKKKMIHLECCSKENLLKILCDKAESERIFYNDIDNLAKNVNSENIRRFEEKYGIYDELKSEIQIDRCLEILAIIDQLKKST